MTATTTTDPRITEPVVYTIRKGDSLSRIAKRYYGDRKYWENIFAQNRDVIRNANRIYPKMKIRLYAIDLGDGTYLVPTKNGGEIVAAVQTATDTTDTTGTTDTTKPESTPAEGETYTRKERGYPPEDRKEAPWEPQSVEEALRSQQEEDQ